MTKSMPRMTVPQLDLRAQYVSLQREVQAALERVCRDQRFILGNEGKALEQELAAYCGISHAVGCASGSDALLLSLVALDVEPGDEVITVPFTFFSTASSVAWLGARASFVDIEPRTFCLEPQQLDRHLQALSADRRQRTRAIIAVHLYGQAADMKAINEAAAHYEIPVIEDAAQALGAEVNGQRVGGLGRTGCLSFYPTKNLGAYGDAGLVTTDDSALADKLRALRQHGSSKEKYRHEVLGWNSRLDELQAAVLRAKLPYLDKWNQARQDCAGRYDLLFTQAGLAASGQTYPNEANPVVIPYRTEGHRHVFHQYVIRADRRDELRHFLREHGVGSEVYYPIPHHLQECFREWGGRPGDYPESERAAAEVLALPMYPELTSEMQQYVVDQVAAFYSRP